MKNLFNNLRKPKGIQDKKFSYLILFAQISLVIYGVQNFSKYQLVYGSKYILKVRGQALSELSGLHKVVSFIKVSNRRYIYNKYPRYHQVPRLLFLFLCPSPTHFISVSITSADLSQMLCRYPLYQCILIVKLLQKYRNSWLLAVQTFM